MAQTALFVSPMARKKKVTEKYEPNSYRVISQQAEPIGAERLSKLPPILQMPDVNILGQGSSDTRSTSEFRHNRPNPLHVNFLRQDVKLLNEPVCNVYTKETRPQQCDWWPHQSSDKPLAKPPHTLDSTVRSDYQYRGSGIKGNTRHSSNPNKEPALGSAPVNFMRKPDGKQRFWKEGISYEHQYNSRLDPQYPIRGKRHGGFVWDEFPPHEVTRMLHHYGYISDKCQQTSASPSADSLKENGKSGGAEKSGESKPGSAHSSKAPSVKDIATETVAKEKCGVTPVAL